MDIDLIAPGLERLIDPDPPLDCIAQEITFGEGPVWDRRGKQLFLVDIIGSRIWKWQPSVGREIVQALKLPDVQERIAGFGFEPVGSTPEEFGKFIQDEIARWTKVVKDSGMRAE